MTRLLGLPLEDRAKLQAWTDHAMRMSGGLATSEELAQSAAETQHFQAYLDERFEAELAHPGEEIMGDLARAVPEAQSTTAGLERWEAVAILFQLVVGGIETTVGLIGATLQHTAQTPDAWSNLREEPESVGAFIEEAVRLDGPAIGNLRRTTRATELAGVALPEGSTLALLWGSANRDEAGLPDWPVLKRVSVPMVLPLVKSMGRSLFRVQGRFWDRIGGPYKAVGPSPVTLCDAQ